MGLKTRLSSYCTKQANNGVNLVTSRKINTRLARPIIQDDCKTISFFPDFADFQVSGRHEQVFACKFFLKV